LIAGARGHAIMAVVRSNSKGDLEAIDWGVERLYR
jgi:hypothetical protein